MTDLALKITETVARLQRELKCGICYSTFKDPILSTCYHMFCRTCINACFERKRKVQCPICRTTLDKRSCRDSYQVTMAVQNYLKLSEVFKKEVASDSLFTSLPPEKMFVESQIPLDVTIIPENDGKRCAPDFAIPMLPVRRRRPSRPSIPSVPSPGPSTSSAGAPDPAPEPEPFVKPQPPVREPVFEVPKRPPPPKMIMKDAASTTDPCEPTRGELALFNISTYINMTRDSLPGIEIDEIDALFKLIPSIRPFIEKNMELLMHKMGIEVAKDKENLGEQASPAKKRVSFGRGPLLLSPEKNVEAGKEEVEVKEPEEEEDEIVEDSEGEQKPPEAMEQAEEPRTSLSTAEADQTAPALQTEQSRIDEELSHVPKTITCSRIHNDVDEVELLSDFYHKFLSNACRFSDDVNAHTTHLIMMNSEGRSIPQKSTAYLHAIARKCIIVGRQWLVDCLKTGLILSEENYTITSCTSVIPSSDPSAEIGWLRSRNDAEGKLFSGCRFMILRKFTINPYFEYKQLIELVQLCGGEILGSYNNLSPEKLFIVFAKDSKSIDESVNMERVYKCEVVTMEWVLDCISEYSILPTDKYKAVEWTKKFDED
ncbi:unnamed protein product [Caenorhabditis sp. 36 PRJEB53466]|nr:unnamed protein product [Caenorhabditis sp. 36 PRJEB53466]